jgi:hypothetical protein
MGVIGVIGVLISTNNIKTLRNLANDYKINVYSKG